MNAGDHIDRFLDWATRWEEAYVTSGFSYCAQRVNGALQLLQGHVGLTGWIKPATALRVADARNLPNVRRLLYEEFDPDVGILKNALGAATERSTRDARDAEGHVATLLFLLGWTVLWLRDPQLGDGPDIIAFTRNAKIAVIECTKGTLDQNDKLAKLMARAQAIRNRLAAAIRFSIDVMPIIVVFRAAAAIPADDIARARRMGIVVVSRDNLQSALESTIVQNDSDRLFDELRASLDNP